MLLSGAETIWRLTEDPSEADGNPLVDSSEMLLTLKPITEALARARWGIAALASNTKVGVCITAGICVGFPDHLGLACKEGESIQVSLVPFS